MAEFVLDSIRADRTRALGHVLLGVIGAVFAVLVWQWWPLPGRAFVLLVAIAASLYELGSGLFRFQKANRLTESAESPSLLDRPRPDAVVGRPCLDCGSALVPGAVFCHVCGTRAIR